MSFVENDGGISFMVRDVHWRSIQSVMFLRNVVSGSCLQTTGMVSS